MEALFQQSFKASTDAYVAALGQARTGSLRLTDQDLDTGSPTTPGEYELADKAYAKLLDKLAAHHFAGIPAGMKADLLRFYSRPATGAYKKKEQKLRIKEEKELAELRAAPQTE